MNPASNPKPTVREDKLCLEKQPQHIDEGLRLISKGTRPALRHNMPVARWCQRFSYSEVTGDKETLIVNRIPLKRAAQMPPPRPHVGSG